uniref:Uncharacterized protein n=1 Tax=Brassica campestris TaxID=3711 RepID=A0A3P5ZYT7_BRACM|nr:unnamed protein product [Brassica rapa]
MCSVEEIFGGRTMDLALPDPTPSREISSSSPLLNTYSRCALPTMLHISHAASLSASRYA